MGIVSIWIAGAGLGVGACVGSVVAVWTGVLLEDGMGEEVTVLGGTQLVRKAKIMYREWILDFIVAAL
jgi:hypothetical protein